MTITICGSIMFWREMEHMQEELRSLGHTVLIPETSTKGKAYWEHLLVHNPAQFAEEKGAVMKTHLEKVDKADAIYVLNYEKRGIPGYIGPNTFMEMGHAFANGTPLYFLSEPAKDGPLIEEIMGMAPTVIGKTLTSFV